MAQLTAGLRNQAGRLGEWRVPTGELRAFGRGVREPPGDERPVMEPPVAGDAMPEIHRVDFFAVADSRVWHAEAAP